MKKKAVVALADGFEEIEAVTPIDILRRAGLEVIIAGIDKREIVSARGLRVAADVVLMENQESADALVLPGGGLGAVNLQKAQAVKKLILRMNEEKKIIAAICASPAVVLAPLGVLKGRKATCYPGCEKDFAPTTFFSEERVIVDGHIITSRGPGSAAEFSLAIVETLLGKEEALKLTRQMLFEF